MVSNQIFASWRYNPARVVNTDYDFAREPNFKGIKIPIKITDIHKIEKKIALKLVFLVMKTKIISNLCVKKILSKNMLVFIDKREKQKVLFPFQIL